MVSKGCTIRSRRGYTNLYKPYVVKSIHMGEQWFNSTRRDKKQGGWKLSKVNVYVDDLRDCPEGFVIARNYADALVLLREGNVGVLSLDHDLGVGSDGQIAPTGYDLVKAICYEGLRADEIYVHTDNPVGRDNMYKTLVAACKRGIIDKDIKVYHYGCEPNTYSGQ